MRKKLLALLLCLCMVMGLVPVVASGATGNVTVTNGNTVTSYNTLEEALAAAQTGMTVTLQKDITASRVLVPQNVILDLNGHVLTADFAVVVNGWLHNSASTASKLVIPQGMLNIVGDNNGILPVWNPNENCYTLAKASYQQMLRVAADYSYAQYIFIPNLDAETVKLLADGGADNGVSIKVHMSWGNGASFQSYTFPEEMVKKVYSGFKNGVATQVFQMTLTGFKGISDMKISAVVESTAGGAIRSSAQNLDASSFIVTFKDWDGTVLKNQSVSKGGSATAPANPSRTNYTFAGWDKSFDNVTSDLVVTATYTTDKTILSVESTTVNKGASEVTVNIRIVNNPGIAGAVLKLSVDDQMFAYKSASKAGYPGLTLSSPSSKVTTSPYTFLLDSLEISDADLVDGTLFSVKFLIKNPAATGTFDVKLSYNSGAVFDEDYNLLNPIVENGKITIQ